MNLNIKSTSRFNSRHVNNSFSSNNSLSSKYEVFIYENQNWAEIPENVNPAYVRMNDKDFHALLVCKVLPSECGVTGMGGYIVTDISGRFIACRRLGVFWQLTHAKLFAFSYAKEIEPTFLSKKVFAFQRLLKAI